ncbi:hypothetical protein KKG72_06715, partial [bacterium]|nr:hypothetical protein [bacterium]MBU1993941.1 hypothetical protein [bacterium]
MSGIASSAGDLAGTMAGAKTASDIQTVSKFDSADDFIESEVKKDRDVTSGQALVNVDSSENTKRGRSESVGLTGYVSQMFGENAGSAILATVTGVGTAEGMVRKFGPEWNNGIVKPTFNKLADALGFEKSTPQSSSNNSFEQSPKKSGNSNNSKSNYSPENKSKNSVHHKKNPSFLKINDYNKNGKNVQAETADSAKKGTGFFEGISKRVSNAFSVLGDNKLTTTGLSLAAASLFVPTDSDASTVKAPKPDEIKAASGDIKVSSG